MKSAIAVYNVVLQGPIVETWDQLKAVVNAKFVSDDHVKRFTDHFSRLEQ